MKFSAARETLLKPLQTVVGVVERRQTMPILSNVLLSTQGGKLSITATDLEVEMVADLKGGGLADVGSVGVALGDATGTRAPVTSEAVMAEAVIAEAGRMLLARTIPARTVRPTRPAKREHLIVHRP